MKKQLKKLYCCALFMGLFLPIEGKSLMTQSDKKTMPQATGWTSPKKNPKLLEGFLDNLSPTDLQGHHHNWTRHSSEYSIALCEINGSNEKRKFLAYRLGNIYTFSIEGNTPVLEGITYCSREGIQEYANEEQILPLSSLGTATVDQKHSEPSSQEPCQKISPEDCLLNYLFQDFQELITEIQNQTLATTTRQTFNTQTNQLSTVTEKIVITREELPAHPKKPNRKTLPQSSLFQSLRDIMKYLNPTTQASDTQNIPSKENTKADLVFQSQVPLNVTYTDRTPPETVALNLCLVNFGQQGIELESDLINKIFEEKHLPDYLKSKKNREFFKGERDNSAKISNCYTPWYTNGLPSQADILKKSQSALTKRTTITMYDIFQDSSVRKILKLNDDAEFDKEAGTIFNPSNRSKYTSVNIAELYLQGYIPNLFSSSPPQD